MQEWQLQIIWQYLIKTDNFVYITESDMGPSIEIPNINSIAYLKAIDLVSDMYSLKIIDCNI